MFAHLTSLVEQASDKVKDMSAKGMMLVQQSGVLELLELASDSQSSASNADTAPPDTAVTLTAADLLDVPPRWSGTKEEWQLLQRATLRNVDYVACLPATLVCHDSAPSWSTAVQLLQLSDEEATRLRELAVCADATYVPQADLLDWLLTQHDVRVVRSLLVPRFISDEAYWHVLGWKAELQRHCRDAAQLLSLMRLLAPPMPVRPWPPTHEGDATGRQDEEEDDDSMSSGSGSGDDDGAGEVTNRIRKCEPVVLENKIGCKAYWANIECCWRVLCEGQTWRQGEIAKVQRALSVARHNAAQLRQLVGQTSPCSAALLESVRESCEFHKQKLTQLVSEVRWAQDRLRNTVLDADGGDLSAALTHAVDEMAAALAQQDTTCEAGRSAGSYLDETGVTAQQSVCVRLPHETRTAPVETNASPTESATMSDEMVANRRVTPTDCDAIVTRSAPSAALPGAVLPAVAAADTMAAISQVEGNDVDDDSHSDAEESDSAMFEPKLPWEDGASSV